MANDIHIDRMVLDIPGVSAAGMRRIAALVAAELGAAGGLPEAVAMERVSVTLPVGGDRSEASLSRMIVAGVLRDLGRRG
jgi:hypothetical protein